MSKAHKRWKTAPLQQGAQVAVYSDCGKLSDEGVVVGANLVTGIIGVKVWADAPFTCSFKYSHARRRWERACISPSNKWVFSIVKEFLVY